MKAYGLVRLTRDPELTFTSEGTGLAKFGVAWNKANKDKTPQFMECTAWGKRAETIAEYLKKGSQVMIEGEINHETWEKDGQKHQAHKITVYNFHFTEEKK